MSVSILADHKADKADLDAAVAGGDKFVARVAALKKATAEHIAALDQLNLGRDVSVAMRDVQAREQAVMDATENAIAKAQADAGAMLADARAQADAIENEVKAARGVLAKYTEQTKAEASQLLAEAHALKLDAERQAAANTLAARELAAAQAQARAAQELSQKAEASFNAKLAAIRAAGQE